MENKISLHEFLNNLFITNLEFAANHTADFFTQFEALQTPHLTILKCSDSRVQMESFDRTPQNGVFAIRNIGNQISTCEGSIDFGVRVLKTPFLLIIGHSGCGAVEAVLTKNTKITPAIEQELAQMQISTSCMKDAVVENVNNQVRSALLKYRDLVEQGKLDIIGSIYDFKNDFGFGRGRLVISSINDLTDKNILHKKYNIRNSSFL